MTSKSSNFKLLLPLVGIAAVLLLWQAVAWLVGDATVLPGPTATGIAALKLLSAGYWRDLLATSARAFTAWILALAIGVPAGLVLGWSQKLYDSSRAVLAFLRCMPAYMLITIPIAIGYGGEFARIATAAIASAWIITDECAESLRTLPRDRIEVLQAFRASHWFVLSRVLFFEALGRVVVPSAKTQIGIVFIVITVVEALAIPLHGVGARLLTYMSSADMPVVCGFLLLTGLTGVLLNVIVQRTARTVIFWS